MHIVWAKAGRWIWGLRHVFEGKLYFTKDVVDDSFVARTTPPPFRSPELPERAGTFCRNVVIL